MNLCVSPGRRGKCTEEGERTENALDKVLPGENSSCECMSITAGLGGGCQNALSASRPIKHLKTWLRTIGFLQKYWQGTGWDGGAQTRRTEPSKNHYGALRQRGKSTSFLRCTVQFEANFHNASPNQASIVTATSKTSANSFLEGDH